MIERREEEAQGLALARVEKCGWQGLETTLGCHHAESA